MLILVVAAVFGSITAYAWEYKYHGPNPITDISVSLDGRLVDFDVPPQIINNRTMVPVRAIFEAFEMMVNWDESTKTLTAGYPQTDIVVVMTIGSDNLTFYCGPDDVYKLYA